MTRESSLWSWLKKARVTLGPNALHMERIENSIGAGTPDVEGYVSFPETFVLTATIQLPNEGQFWLELKSEERPARTTTPIRFKLRDREKQIEWMKHRWWIGGNAFWLLQVGSGSERMLYLAPGSSGKKLKQGLTESELLVLCCNSGIFRTTISPERILKRVIQCRTHPSLTKR